MLGLEILYNSEDDFKLAAIDYAAEFTGSDSMAFAEEWLLHDHESIRNGEKDNFEPTEMAGIYTDAWHTESTDSPVITVKANRSGSDVFVTGTTVEEDSREKLEADVRKLYTYSTSTLMYPPSANKTTDYIGYVSVDTVRGWLDRQAAITDAEWKREADEHREAVERRASELQAKVDEYQHAMVKAAGKWAKADAECAELQAQVDSLTKELRKFKDMNNEAGDEIADLECERDYWKQQVQLCMDAAYPQSHSPERRYDPDVMAYPDRNGCTTPSTLVCDVIDGLRDGFQDKMMPILVEAAEAKQDVERWREGCGRILDEIHEIEGIIGGLGER